MRSSFYLFCFSACLLFFSSASQATVVLVYHHVSESTPKSTSKDNGFTVIPLNEMIDSLKAKKPLADKTIVITFDDGYSDILYNGHPLLKKYGFPYTMFINPDSVPNKPGIYLDWQQIKQMSDEGVLIANHGLKHDSLIKVPLGTNADDWLEQKLTELQQSEEIIAQKTGQSWKYFALPYGEYTPIAQQKLADLGYAVVTQQSGPVGDSTDLTAIPRFPASMPYDQLAPLKDKLNSVAFELSQQTQRSSTVVDANNPIDTNVELKVDDFYPTMLACFVAGKGQAEVKWHKDNNGFTMNFDTTFAAGRQRVNCTAPSISKPGRYYWYSKPWFVPNKDGSWYKD